MESRLYCVCVLLLIGFLQTVQSLSCFQCNSTLDHNCQEFFPNNNPDSPLRTESCTMYNAKFCIKVTGLWGGIVGTHRFCSSRDLGNQCQDMRFPDHSRKYRGCIYTCTSDGCNSAPSIVSSLTVTMATALSLLVVWFVR